MAAASQSNHITITGIAKILWELVEKRAEATGVPGKRSLLGWEATSEAQDIVTSTAILSTVLFADCTVEPFFNKLLGPVFLRKSRDSYFRSGPVRDRI